MSERKHLLHVFSTFVAAGPQVRTVQLIAAFADAYRHTIVAMDGRTQARELLDSSCEVRFLPAPPKAGSLRTALRLRTLLREEKPDLLLSYNFGAIDALLAARLHGAVPCVHHEDGFGPDEALTFKRRREWMRRWLLPRTKKLVVISETLRKIALERWNETPLHVRFIPNGIDIEAHSARDGNAQLRSELGIPAQCTLVGAVGHLRAEKNLPRLLTAIARSLQHADVHLLVLGDGPMRAELEQQAAHEPLLGRVHFVGHVVDPRPYYRAMDVFALSSDTEQMPLALLEAMATQLPVVATNVGDVVAMLPGEQAAFVTLPGGAGCTAALAASIVRLGGDPTLRARLGKLNFNRARQHYSQPAMIAAYREVYSQALTASR
jgi:glycosyltransferase involved in cell wall biosynthesis